MDLLPLGDRVLILPDQNPTETASGLHLVEHYKPEQTGHVAAVGERVREVTVGQHVVFSWNAGQELWINDGESRYLILKEKDLLAVLELTHA